MCTMKRPGASKPTNGSRRGRAQRPPPLSLWHLYVRSSLPSLTPNFLCGDWKHLHRAVSRRVHKHHFGSPGGNLIGCLTSRHPVCSFFYFWILPEYTRDGLKMKRSLFAWRVFYSLDKNTAVSECVGPLCAMLQIC